MSHKDWSSLTLTNNKNNPKKRFELHVDDKIAFIEYILAKEDTIYLTHTEVPRPLEGNGLGSALVKKTLAFIEEKGYQLVPLCPFVAAYLKRYPDTVKRILKKGYSI
ncbi:N-acetyltransferase [Aquimarina sp. U1-2]|uniref:GNAT family N-acetyltransferase n=1 Tax=Aquimarina sp. U1-2 TaxID=2823141 RepID=UPI001AEC7A74|nr:GNAT family N-acetyltransferase [Aquimarina sp. U1-2]MBP2830971.1 N-acetyltransferase [Aquimarina sp. U1-2]